MVQEAPGRSFFSRIFGAFFTGLFGVAGALVGLVALSMVIAVSVTQMDTDKGIQDGRSIKVLPGPDGKRMGLKDDSPLILQINLSGVIGTEQATGERMRTLLTQVDEGALKDGRVKGILLYLRTPGGSAPDSEMIYSLLQEFKERSKIPIYAYGDAMLASGGMMIACAADKIYASPGTLVGSVGVVTAYPFFNFSQAMEKVGISALSLAQGKNKDALSPFLKWQPGEEAGIQGAIQESYEQFINIVSQSRPLLTKAKLKDQYGANIYLAPTAKKLGYCDEIAPTISTPLKALAEKAGIADQEFQVVELSPRFPLRDILGAKAPWWISGKFSHTIDLGTFMQESSEPFLYLYRPHFPTSF